MLLFLGRVCCACVLCAVLWLCDPQTNNKKISLSLKNKKNTKKTQQKKAARLWAHEAERVFRDRLVSDADGARFDEFLAATAKEHFGDLPGGAPAVLQRPLLFASFMVRVGVCVLCCGVLSCVVCWVSVLLQRARSR